MPAVSSYSTRTLTKLLGVDSSNNVGLSSSLDLTGVPLAYLYNTFTDASNYERAKIGWNSNVLEIGTEKAGTGSSRAMRLIASGFGSVLNFNDDTANHWSIQSSLFFKNGTNTNGSLLNSPSDYSGGLFLNNTGPTYFAMYSCIATGSGSWSAMGRSTSAGGASAAGQLFIHHEDGMICIGGTTSSFPGLVNSGTELRVRLADATADASLRAKSVRGTAVTFANVPSSPVEGMLVAVTDSSTVTWGATITGGSTNHVLAYYNGTNWTVAGK